MTEGRSIVAHAGLGGGGVMGNNMAALMKVPVLSDSGFRQPWRYDAPRG